MGRVPVAVPGAARLRRVLRRGVLRPGPPDRPAPPARRPSEPQPTRVRSSRCSARPAAASPRWSGPGWCPRCGSSPDWVITDPWTPSDVPLAEMSLALAHAAKLNEADLDADRVPGAAHQTSGGMADVRTRDARGGTGLSRHQGAGRGRPGRGARHHHAPQAERVAFLEALTTSCTAPSPLRVVMTARTDMWDEMAAETGKSAMPVRRPCCTSRRCRAPTWTR